ncbi:MAG: rod shape-determining protein MreC [Chloroflexi bacterium]|jgi:rod shape-determining protein MreC|nr:rod shape-determining protein MreC [Chloroflexota bacterium]
MRLLWWTLAVVSVSLFSILLSENRTLDPLQNLSLTIAAPMENGLRDVADPISDFFRGIFNRGDLVRENERLREELERLQTETAATEDAQRRLQELEEALGVKENRPDDVFVVADVIAQDPSGFKRALAIDRGSKDGLDEGMVVLSKSGSLVGVVSLVYEEFAWLRLISDPNNAVNIAVLTGGEEGSEARGVAVGDLRSRLSLEMLPTEAQIQEGDLVITSGLGGNYPRTLLLGSVTSVEEKPQALAKRATMEPAADLSSLDTVLIITNFRPARLEGP